MDRSTRICVVFAVLCSCAEPQENAARSKAVSALIVPAECMFFEQGGVVDICHATGSSKNPYVDIRTSDQGCINGHSNHPGDFIDLNQSGSCASVSCLPTGAP